MGSCSNMPSFEEDLQDACDQRDLPGVVLSATNATGDFVYQNAFGARSPDEPMELDSVFVMASTIKLLTSVAAVQCVERGQISLDEDVSTVLTELKDAEIIQGFDNDGQAILIKAENKITLRHLLTHTSGISYDLFHPYSTRWRKSRGQVPDFKGLPLLERIKSPLLFEPGTAYQYGHGIDWAGQMVARLNNTTLGKYMQANIFAPLDIKDITFHIEQRPDLGERTVAMSARHAKKCEPLGLVATRTDTKVSWTDENPFDSPVLEDFGGQGGFCAIPEYMKIMRSLLSNDGALLTPSSVDILFAPQLSGTALESLEGVRSDAMWKETFACTEPGVKVNHGLGGLLIMSEMESGVQAGTMTWSGVANLMWMLDRQSGLGLFYGSNLLPFGDYKSHDFQQRFESMTYERFAVWQAAGRA